MVCSPGVEDTKSLYIVTRLKDRYCQSNKDIACGVCVLRRGVSGFMRMLYV